MKAASLPLMIVSGLALFASAGSAADGQAGAALQTTATNGLPALPSATRAGAQTNLHKLFLQPGTRRGTSKQSLAMNTPAPGAYETRPYTCIVIVPGAHPDERMAHWNGKGKSNMPVITPELEFIPRVAK